MNASRAAWQCNEADFCFSYSDHVYERLASQHYGLTLEKGRQSLSASLSLSSKSYKALH